MDSHYEHLNSADDIFDHSGDEVPEEKKGWDENWDESDKDRELQRKTIKEEMAEIVKQTKNLEKLIEEYEEIITPNKIWLPGLGIVKLWETK